MARCVLCPAEAASPSLVCPADADRRLAIIMAAHDQQDRGEWAAAAALWRGLRDEGVNPYHWEQQRAEAERRAAGGVAR